MCTVQQALHNWIQWDGMMFRGLKAALSAPATVPVYSATGTA